MSGTTRRRIVYVSATDELGGADASLFELVQGLDRDRFEPHVVVPHSGPFAARYAAVGVPVHVVPLKKLKNTKDPRWHLAWLLRAPIRIVRLLRLFARLQPAVVHVNTSVEALAGIAARLHCRRSGARLVWHVRECELRPRWMERALFALVARQADAVVAISSAVAQRIARQERVYVIPNGLDVTRFRAAPRVPAGPPTIGWVGRLGPGKGFENVLAVFRQVRATLPDARLLVVAADHPEHRTYTDSLRAAAADFGDAVEWSTDQDAPERALARMHVFVHLPDLREGLGRTVLEAQAAGVVVVTWPRGGLVDAVQPDITGVFAADGDIAAASAAVLRLLQQPERRAAMARAGTTFVHEHFSRQRCAAAVGAAYSEILS